MEEEICLSVYKATLESADNIDRCDEAMGNVEIQINLCFMRWILKSVVPNISING